MKTIFLIILDGYVPSISIWKDIFSDLEFIKIVNEIPTECDAIVVSPSICDVFGCQAGKNEDDFGIMCIYDQFDLPEKHQCHPRFLISNAIWKEDPYLLEAISIRVFALFKAISQFNRNSLFAIEKPAIKTEILGFWRSYPDAIQEEAISVLKSALVCNFAHLNKGNEETILYRPIGEMELAKIKDLEFKEFPPRLIGQPIFYPVLNYEYAVQIARDWNTKDEMSGFAGYVTRFKVRSKFLQKYQIKTVGGEIHQEYWIPAEDLDEFNQNIIGKIELIDMFKK